MKKIVFSLAIFSAALAGGVAHADSKKPVPLWLCSDYLDLNETYRPIALGFAEALNNKGKVEDATLDIEGITKVTPSLLTYCQENPKIALRDALAQTKAAKK